MLPLPMERFSDRERNDWKSLERIYVDLDRAAAIDRADPRILYLCAYYMAGWFSHNCKCAATALQWFLRYRAPFRRDIRIVWCQCSKDPLWHRTDACGWFPVPYKVVNPSSAGWFRPGEDVGQNQNRPPSNRRGNLVCSTADSEASDRNGKCHWNACTAQQRLIGAGNICRCSRTGIFYFLWNSIDYRHYSIPVRYRCSCRPRRNPAMQRCTCGWEIEVDEFP